MTLPLPRSAVRLSEPVEICLADNADKGHWRAFVTGNPKAGPLHHFDWQEILTQCYAVHPQYLLARSGEGTVRGILPAYAGRSLFTGRYLATMEGGIVSSDPQATKVLLAHALAVRDTLQADYFLHRGVEEGLPGADREQRMVRTVINLEQGTNSIWNISLSSNTRRKIRRAEKCGFRVTQDNDQITDFYRHFSANQRDLGTPTIGAEVLHMVRSRLPEQMRLYVIEYKEQIIGGMFAMLSSQGCHSLYVGMRKDLLRMYPTYLLYWEAIKGAAQEGCTFFDLGRSALHGGTHAFKQQWGGRDDPVVHTYFYRQGVSPSNSVHPGSYSLKQKIWRNLPTPVANWLGPSLRRSLPFV